MHRKVQCTFFWRVRRRVPKKYIYARGVYSTRIFTIEENIHTRSNLSVQVDAVIHTSLCELLFPTQKNNLLILYTIFFYRIFILNYTLFLYNPKSTFMIFKKKNFCNYFFETSIFFFSIKKNIIKFRMIYTNMMYKVIIIFKNNQLL